MSATTFTYAILQVGGTWVGYFTFMNNISVETVIGYTSAMYVLSSILKVNMGSVFPTDCIASLIPITVIIGLHYMIMAIEKAVQLCPMCDQGFCYYDT